MLLGQSILITVLQASLCLGYGTSEIQRRFLTCGDPSLQCDYGVIRVYEVKFRTTDGLSSNKTPKACSDTESFNGVSKRCDGKGKCEVATSGSVCDLCNSAHLTHMYLDVTYGCLESKKVTTCDGDGVVHLECGDGVVFLQKALYGRTDSQTCSQGRPQSQLTNTKCSQEGTLALWSQRCDGKQVCEVNMRETQISDPCYGTYKYLDVTYACLPAKTSITCEHSTSSLDCGKGVIQVFHANYGRRDGSTCSAGRHELSNQNCLQPKTLDVVKQWCEGKSQCTVGHDAVFGDPCYGTYKYLEVSYTCLGGSPTG
ncbi:L-rhamnose-binding lectin CSL1 [Coregonus clupeaformis]|uniref:L-rhamnose-binding lectin CSL1 n=1 Tax=Coregonus clupeaformis TaxID=59861 RepID=UPI001E1C9421|nr:L-rhamnose-binding lectin CSL1 [Coregonus clupeaformis]